MRKILQAIKALGIILAVAGCAVISLLLLHSPVFEQGESYELYLGASSSSPVCAAENPVWDKLLVGAVSGESVRYEGDRYEEIAQRFQAKLLFTEEVCGVTNYYMYSPLLGGGTAICGYVVNLHIAVRDGMTAAGTPLIFGGF